MRSSFFYDRQHQSVSSSIQTYLNSTPDFLSAQTIHSTRAVGDALEGLVADKFDEFLGSWCKEYSSNFARRAMADIAFKDREDFYCVVDVKTHREDTKFNMPNLTSVERISRFYEDDKNIFALILIKYVLEGNLVRVTGVTFEPIEFLDWNCLTVGALGWGQIQIANSNNLTVNHGFSRKQWMLKLCEVMLEFYPKEITKIQGRIGRFQQIQLFWEQKQDAWGDPSIFNRS